MKDKDGKHFLHTNIRYHIMRYFWCIPVCVTVSVFIFQMDIHIGYPRLLNEYNIRIRHIHLCIQIILVCFPDTYHCHSAWPWQILVSPPTLIGILASIFVIPFGLWYGFGDGVIFEWITVVCRRGYRFSRINIQGHDTVGNVSLGQFDTLHVSLCIDALVHAYTFKNV